VEDNLKIEIFDKDITALFPEDAQSISSEILISKGEALVFSSLSLYRDGARNNFKEHGRKLAIARWRKKRFFLCLSFIFYCLKRESS